MSNDSKPNHGIVKLIEDQKHLKYFEWSNSFDDSFKDDDPYEQILLALEKNVESLNYLNIFFQDVEDYKHTLLHEILPYDIIYFGFNDDGFNKDFLNFIRKVYKKYPSIEYLSILILPTKDNFIELKNLLKRYILEEISENWRGRRALSIFTIDSIYIGEDYTKVINEYKSNRVIKDFEYSRFDYGINYCHR
ncbi:hypothetical protein RhiirA1_476991 [Rhizophagus irregularis]|uniref:Uncharacterized protein n=1 Tax=Rhizophagus irregularis TaxID=588596 RepID=A0A2N0QU89_9GLOM|nr:hypothetical protein RhiirA1_476991 [Rhizophagus irregularis]